MGHRVFYGLSLRLRVQLVLKHVQNQIDRENKGNRIVLSYVANTTAVLIDHNFYSLYISFSFTTVATDNLKNYQLFV